MINRSEVRIPPIWVMGLSNSTMGLYLGLAFFVIPQLLAARGVPAETITGITAAAYSPSFWSVFLAHFWMCDSAGAGGRPR